MTKARNFSLSLSLVLGAGTLAVGLVPQPMVFLAGALLLGLLGVVTLRFRGWRWVQDRELESSHSVFAVGCVVAMTLASLLRSTDWSFVLVPVVSIAVTTSAFYWLDRHVDIQDSRSSSDP
ncbi:hypothetical protein SAMN04487917_102358 [Arthrobacter sp. yr096]|nr:hypothetical protein SAMN04487912_101235 [Arthrobacter sp. cf158]SEI76934.1 hypothetical protein SAMN04487917_102358 [Arthrobacter sp. yr096]